MQVNKTVKKCRNMQQCDVIICEIIVHLLVIVQNIVLLLRTLRLFEIRACETADELVRVTEYKGRELWCCVGLLERDNTGRNNDRVTGECLK
jgi:hypothetical protein